MRLKDKVCLVTGGGNGIGRAAAVKFAQEGARVVVIDLNDNAIDETVNSIVENGGEALGFMVDITKKEQIAEMVKVIMEKYNRIDVLVNNAGIIMDAQLKNMTDDQFDKVIDVNLKGTYLCTKAVVDIMINQNYGVILNTSSIVGIYGNFGQTNYAATKFGVIGFTKTWAKELGRKGIRTNAVCPGFIATSIIDPMPERVIKAMEDKVPMKRLGKPEEIANVYAFLASDEASYVNGAVIEVSGGIVI
ncbi:3-oxoacyl-ACP reductase FabG [Alkaliphilus pronyensis]|uniref:3-oxoacyl-ACP reductase FabG n=1 Tax=Alkaliphilus pronyensis TaxID=1482732 RepID=A0A6I0FDA4_9FIRM|nr:3-oxoacyl-ACP reductase FabG [Alkaliphilus pronyensis]KAB3532147.1 3-oxoacyl-ACP reductase FabG [Alkaliphilus pronyensis]